MPKPRNYWVLRGARGAAARQKYLDYLAGLVDTGQPDGTVSENRPPRISLYLSPFAIPLAIDTVETESAESLAWAAMSGVAAVNTRVTDAIGTDTPVKIKSYRAPRVVRVEIDKTGTVARSKFTGLPYTKYDHTSRSVPFGKKTGDTTIESAYAEIQAAIDNGDTIRTRLIDERY